MMSIPFSQRVRAPGDVLMRELDDESVLLHLDREVYFGLDDVGTRMWTALVSADSIQAAWEVLLSEFDVEPDVLRHDLDEFLAQMIEQDLLRIDRDEAA